MKRESMKEEGEGKRQRANSKQRSGLGTHRPTARLSLSPNPQSKTASRRQSPSDQIARPLVIPVVRLTQKQKQEKEKKSESVDDETEKLSSRLRDETNKSEAKGQCPLANVRGKRSAKTNATAAKGRCSDETLSL